MYCEDHENICCSACIAIKHRTCKKIEYLPGVVKGVKVSAEYKKVKDELSQLIRQLEKAKATRKEELTMLDVENKALMAEINTMEDELKERVGLLAQHTRDKLKAKYTERKTALNGSIQSIQSFIERLNEKEVHLADDNEVRVFASEKEGKVVVNESRSLLKEIPGQTIQRLNFVPNSNIQNVLKYAESFGTVDVKEQTETARNNVQEYRASLVGKYNFSDKQYGISATCCLDEDTLLMFDNTDKQLKRLNIDKLKVIAQLKMENLSQSLCPAGTQEVAVALWNEKIQFVSVGEIMTITRQFRVDHICRGMVYNECSRELFVNHSYNEIKVYDKTGNVLRNFCSDVSPFKYLESMAFSEDKKTMYMADREKGILALSMSGKMQWTFTDPDLCNARGVCVLPDDIILVSGCTSNNVLQIDKHGKKLGVLLGAGDQLKSPWSLAYDRKISKLIVGHQIDTIHVYNLVA